MTTSNQLKQNVEIVYGYMPYMLKRTCVEIIHFFELFTKYDLINASTDTGFAEQMRWELLVEAYLEKAHMCVDKQRKIFSNVCDFVGKNLDSERNEIILPPTIEHKVIMELRRANHKEALMITRFLARSVGGMSQPYPGIAFHECNFNEAQKEYADKLNSSNANIHELFVKHCEQTLDKSKKLKELLLGELNA